MPYHDTPQPAEAKNVIQGLLSDNFQYLNTFLTVNHAALTSQGKHILVTLPEIAAPATIANTAILYAAHSAITGQSELFMRRQKADGTDETISMSERGVGWTQMGPGMIIKYGQTVLPLTATAPVIYPPATPLIPRFNHVYGVYLSVYAGGGADSDTSVRVSDYTTSVDYFTVYASRRYGANGAPTEFTWLAIGD